MTTSSAASDENFIKMVTFSFIVLVVYHPRAGTVLITKLRQVSLRPSDAIKVSENLVNISSGNDSAPNRSQAIALMWRHVVSEIQGSFYVGVQPVKGDLTLKSRLSLAECIHKMIPGDLNQCWFRQWIGTKYWTSYSLMSKSNIINTSPCHLRTIVLAHLTGHYPG